MADARAITVININPEPREAGSLREGRGRLVYICDWLPPDYGAVGQYSMLFAREMAKDGRDVVLGGLTSTASEATEETIGKGRIRVIKLHAERYEKANVSERVWWTVKANTRLILTLWPHLRWADEVLFTGSPPLFLHWIAPLNLFLRKKLVYRITDFHPECSMAGHKAVPVWLAILYRLTLFWRRRVSAFEVLGLDQLERLKEVGIPPERIRLKRDPVPVEITSTTLPLARPVGDPETLLLLYSGNWGAAHDHETFVEGYRRHHVRGKARFVLWLNAVGRAVDDVEAALTKRGLPFVRGTPLPLDELACLLVTPEAHLITLSDEFVGFVLPSKVHGCIASGKPVLYIGSTRSDVHKLCAEKMTAAYERVDVGDAVGCAAALNRLADLAIASRANSLATRTELVGKQIGLGLYAKRTGPAGRY